MEKKKRGNYGKQVKGKVFFYLSKLHHFLKRQINNFKLVDSENNLENQHELYFKKKR